MKEITKKDIKIIKSLIKLKKSLCDKNGNLDKKGIKILMNNKDLIYLLRTYRTKYLIKQILKIREDLDEKKC